MDKLSKLRCENMVALSRTSPVAEAMREAHEIELTEFFYRGSHQVAAEALERLKTLRVNVDNEKLSDEAFRAFTGSFLDVFEQMLNNKMK